LGSCMKIRVPSLFSTISFFLDGLLVAASFHLANWIRFYSGWIKVDGVTFYPHYKGFIALVVAVYWIVFKYAGLYRKRRGVSVVDELSKIVQSVFTASVLIAASTFLIHFFTF